MLYGSFGNSLPKHQVSQDDGLSDCLHQALLATKAMGPVTDLKLVIKGGIA